MTKLLGISGSLRAKSLNTFLLRAVQASVAGEVQMEAATLHGVPRYDGDEEQKYGIPEPFVSSRSASCSMMGLF